VARRLALLALLAGVLVAVPGPHDRARAAVPGQAPARADTSPATRSRARRRVSAAVA